MNRKRGVIKFIKLILKPSYKTLLEYYARVGDLDSSTMIYLSIPKCLKASIIASILSVGTWLILWDTDCLLGATFTGNPHFSLVSAIQQVLTIYPYLFLM